MISHSNPACEQHGVDARHPQRPSLRGAIAVDPGGIVHGRQPPTEAAQGSRSHEAVEAGPGGAVERHQGDHEVAAGQHLGLQKKTLGSGDVGRGKP